MNTEAYKQFIMENPSVGYLKIKAYSANEAIPISGLNIVISKDIGGENVIFFDGSTNESGIIERITLPAPKLTTDNLNTPLSTIYEIISLYNGVERDYSVRIFEGVYVVQNINVIPDVNTRGNNYGS